MPAFESIPQIFYSVPLIVAFSFCYAATRFEETQDILKHAARWIAGMTAAAVVFSLLLFL